MMHPSLPRSGGFLDAIRQSSRELRISSNISVNLLIDNDHLSALILVDVDSA